MSTTPHCIVVGAGPGGLYAGHLLQKAGCSYEILEATDRVGGRVVTNVRGRDYIDVGAQVFHSSYEHCERLIRTLGLDGERVPVDTTPCYRRRDGVEWVQGGSPYMPGLGLRGNFALWSYALGRLMSRHGQRLHRIERANDDDAISADDYMRRGGTDEFHQYLVPLLCAAMNVSSPQHTSLQHLHHIFRIASFTRTYTFRNGNAQLWQSVAAGQPIKRQCEVAELLYSAGRVRGVRLAATGEVRPADHVIVSVAPHVTESLLPAEMTRRRAFFRDLVKIAQCIPVVYLDRRLDERIVNYMGDLRDGRHFVMALDAANKAPALVPSGKSVLMLWDYYPRGASLSAAPSSQVVDLAIGDLPALVPGFSTQWVQDVELVRHAYSHTPYGPGSYRRIVEFVSQESGRDGIHFTSDLFGGSYMECALIMAHRAVARIVPDAISELQSM